MEKPKQGDRKLRVLGVGAEYQIVSCERDSNVFLIYCVCRCAYVCAYVYVTICVCTCLTYTRPSKEFSMGDITDHEHPTAEGDSVLFIFVGTVLQLLAW